MGAMMNKIPVPQQQQPQPPQQMNPKPPAMSQYNAFENVIPNQMPGTHITGTQMPEAQIHATQMLGAEMPVTQITATQIPVADMPPNMFKMQRGRSKKLL